MATNCRNCGTPLEAVYCPRCGQKDLDLERPILSLLRDLLEETFELDGRAARTLRALLFRPGLLTAEYLAGHRRRYSPPVRLYLVVSVSFFLLATWVASRGLLLEVDQDLAVDAPDQARFLGEQLPRLMFVMLPVFALMLKLAYRRRLYFDHLIFALHYHSLAYIVLALVLPLEEAADRHWPLLVVQLSLFMYMLAYLALALRRVYRSSPAGASFKTAALLMGYLVLISAVIEQASSFLIIGD